MRRAIGNYKIDARFNKVTFRNERPDKKNKSSLFLAKTTKRNFNSGKLTFSKAYQYTKAIVCVSLIVSAVYFGYSNSKHPVKATINGNSTNVTGTAGAEEPPSSPLKKDVPFVSADPPAGYDTAEKPQNDLKSIFVKYFGSLAGQAEKVAMCESGLNPKAKNPVTPDYGIMQINFPTWGHFFNVTIEQLDNPDINIKLAEQIYARSNNWSAWSSSYKCHHQK